MKQGSKLALGLLTLLALGSAPVPKQYRDAANGLMLSYPADLRLVTGAAAKTETASGEMGSGAKLLKLAPASIPEKYRGFWELNVWRDPAQAGGCKASQEETQPLAPFAALPRSRKIGAAGFALYEEIRAGMSKTHTTVGYRGVVRKACWQFQLVMHQTSAAGPVTPFDTQALKQYFERFLASVKL